MASSSPTSPLRPGQLLTAGLILYRIVNGKREYLIVKENNRFHEWAMPKGRIKIGEGETELEAAKRETQEEVGVPPTAYDIFPVDFVTRFQYGSDRKYKRVTCFGARVKDPNIGISLTDEHTEFKWSEFKDLSLKSRISNAYSELEQALIASQQN